MTYLLGQIFLLLTGAFLLGAVVACLLRTLLFGGGASREDEPTVAPTPERSDAPPRAASPAQDRFSRALTGAGLAIDSEPKSGASALGATAPPPTSPMADAVRAAAAALAEERRAKSEAARPPASTSHAAAPPPPQPPAAPKSETRPPSPAAAPSAAPPQAAPPSQETRPPPAPPSSPASSPCFAPEIVVEPAAKTAGAAAVSVAPPAGPPRAPEPPKPTPPAPSVGPAKIDDLTLIRGVDRAAADTLIRLGVTRFEDIARWRAGDVARANSALAVYGRVERENWIEQASVLAKAERRTPPVDSAPPKPAAAPPKPAQPATPPPAAAKSAEVAPPSPPPLRDMDAALSPRTLAPAPPKPVEAATPPPSPAKLETAAPPSAATVGDRPSAPPSPAGDSLRRIVGIDAAAEQLLHAQGVTRFSQVANWTFGDVRRIERMLGRVGRVVDENWIEQARVLAEGTPAAPRPRSAFEGMKSVRSEALRGAAPESREGKPVDDLKRIRGIGVLIERRLNSLAVTGFEQIANWTGADIDRVSRALDVKDKIERENWVEQARILASGGQTAYSRRPQRSE